MNDQEKELMQRYIYNVTKRISKDQRQDIAMELEELISDMHESEHISVEEVLIRLGDPKEFVKKYQNDHNYLIGPDCYDNYLFVLKIVMICVCVSAVIGTFFHLDYSASIVKICIRFFDHLLENLGSGLIGGFGLVTMIFVIIDRAQVETTSKDSGKVRKSDEDSGKSHTWTPSQLAPLPIKKAQIQRSDTLVSMVVTIVLCCIFAFAPQLFGAYCKDSNGIIQNIPLFNLEKWVIMCPLFLIALGAGFIDDVVKLVTACYGRVVLITNVVTNMIILILSTIIFKALPVWNTRFVQDLEVFNFNIGSKGDLLYYWNTPVISNVILAGIWLLTLGEIAFTIYKTVRYTR